MINIPAKVVILTLQDRKIIVPDNALAEVISFGGLVAESCAQQWMLGHKHWNNLRVPVISFELLAGGSLKRHTEHAKIAIFNRHTKDSPLSFWGMLIQDISNTIPLDKLDLIELDPQHSNAELMSVEINGDCVQIPDLSYIEQSFLNVGIS